MITINLNNPGLACEAIEWCNTNIPHDSWEFNMFWPAQGYEFKFSDSKTATLFSLKWAGAI